MYFSHCAAWDAGNRHGLGDSVPWGKDESEAIKVFERAFRTVGAPWGIPPEAGSGSAGVVTREPAPAPLEAQSVKSEGVKFPIMQREEDDIPMVHDTDKKGIVSPEEIEFHRVCEPREAAANKYLRQHPNPQLRIGEKQTFRDASLDYMKRVLRNPANFITAVEAVK